MSSHTPENGKIVLVYAPHIGLDYLCNVGQVYRLGQKHPSPACGAAIGAYNLVKDNPKEAAQK